MTSAQLDSNSGDVRILEAPGRGPRAFAAAMAEALPLLLSPEDAKDLLALLEYSLAVPSAAERRHDTLGLIVRLIHELRRLPGARAYDQAHREATERGERWPDRSTLIRRYGRYENAELAAARYVAKGSASRVPDSFQHSTRRPPNGTYKGTPTNPVPVISLGGVTRPRIAVEAIVAFSDTHNGAWPVNLAEFSRWATRQRLEARRKGLPPPNLPCETLMREFGPFEETVQLARATVQRSARSGD